MFFLMAVQVSFWGVGNMAAEGAARRGAQLAAGLAPAAAPGGGPAPVAAECRTAETAVRAAVANRANRWGFSRLDGTPEEAIEITWEERRVEVAVDMRASISFFGWRWPIRSEARETYSNWGEINIIC